MKRTIVRYKAAPDRIEENKRLIEAVFQELHAKGLTGVRYAAVALPDGTFIHMSEAEDDAPQPITSLDAFRTYVAGIAERCTEQPVPAVATIVGNYRMLG
jgi:hypothetical protein